LTERECNVNVDNQEGGNWRI